MFSLPAKHNATTMSGCYDELGTDSYCASGMKPNDFGDPLTFSSNAGVCNLNLRLFCPSAVALCGFDKKLHRHDLW